MARADTTLGLDDVAAVITKHVTFYRWKAPHYETVMLNSLLPLWQDHPDRLLDIGGGTGVIAQCIAAFFPVGHVVTIDVVDRFRKTLDIETRTFDGHTLPFMDASFDVVTLNNVVHHVPVEERISLFKEIRRVSKGALYIKDHETRSSVDGLRLTALDILGNVPFGGMVRASYLDRSAWHALADATGFAIAEETRAVYRTGAFAALFPNRLEITMRWEPT